MQGGCECCLEWARANIVTKQTVSQKAAARMVQGAGGGWSQECCPLTTRPLHCCRHSVIWFYDTALSSVLPPDVGFCLQFYVFVAQKPLISD